MGISKHNITFLWSLPTSSPAANQAGRSGCVRALVGRALHNVCIMFLVFTGLARLVLMFYSECVRRRFLVVCFLYFFFSSFLPQSFSLMRQLPGWSPFLLLIVFLLPSCAPIELQSAFSVYIASSLSCFLSSSFRGSVQQRINFLDVFSSPSSSSSP